MALTDLIPFTRRNREERNLPVRREANDPFAVLREEMNQLFEDFMPGFGRRRGGLPGFGSRGWDFTPQVDVKETGKEIRVSAELPGVDEKDLEVRLDGNTLTIRGEKREEKTEKDGDWSRSECCYGSFVRSIPLGVKVDADGIDASFKRGVLKVKLPKAEADDAAKGRIEVKAG